MPSKNRRQQKALYAKFGSAWVHEHHFDEVATSKRPKQHRKTEGKHGKSKS